MDMAEGLQIFEELKKTKHSLLFDKMVRCAVIYARIRAEWYFSKSQQKNDMNDERTMAHDEFIHSYKMLCEKMEETGEDTAWKYAVGFDRRSIGDFACMIHAFIGIMAR